MDAVPVSMNFAEVNRDLHQITGSVLVNVVVGTKEFPALVKEKQRDVLTGNLIHVDFQVVSMTETVKANVSVQYEGESPAVKELTGILVAGLESLEVESLPQDLPSRFVVDISVLEELGDAIYVRDLAVPANVTMLTEPDEMIVLVTGREITEEELEEEEVELEDVEGEEPEVIEKGKREEEED
jgi:large subunit ribosomal protein L25